MVEPVTDDEFKSLLGEGFHTAFRKATDDPKSSEIWKLIQDLDPKSWDSVLGFVVWGLGVSGFELVRK